MSAPAGLIDFFVQEATEYLDRLRSLLAAQKSEGRDDLAAWTTVARVLLNLDEFITRE